MKILTICDKENSAIWKLAKTVQQYNPHHNIDVIAVHPKRPDPDQLHAYYSLANDADLLDFQYWKTAKLLLELYPELKNKVKSLHHHNPYDLEKHTWEEFDGMVVHNSYQQSVLPDAVMIPHGADHNFFTWNDNYKQDGYVMMVANRIEGKKGIEEVGKVCQKLGYRFVLVGNISDGEYFEHLTCEFHRNVTDEELLELYKGAALFVCNSVDNYESGTMPILEAIAVGVPVLTRNIGHVPDIAEGNNIRVREGQPHDLEDLEKNIKDLMENPEERMRMREEASKITQRRNAEKRARQYSEYYRGLVTSDPLVSIILPVFNKRKEVLKVISEYLKQDYKNIEFVVCDDNSDVNIKDTICLLQRESGGISFKYLNTYNPGYGLANARNEGAIEAEGEYLLFNDVRFYPEKTNTIREALKQIGPKQYLSFPRDGKDVWTEGESFIKKSDFIAAGMFCERMTKYGGLSQETRYRFNQQGFNLKVIKELNFVSQIGSKNRRRLKQDIINMKNKLFKMGI